MSCWFTFDVSRSKLFDSIDLFCRQTENIRAEFSFLWNAETFVIKLIQPICGILESSEFEELFPICFRQSLRAKKKSLFVIFYTRWVLAINWTLMELPWKQCWLKTTKTPERDSTHVDGFWWIESFCLKAHNFGQRSESCKWKLIRLVRFFVWLAARESGKLTFSLCEMEANE